MRPLELRDIIWQNSIAQEAIDRHYKKIENYESDVAVVERQKQKECPFCFYFKLAGMGVDSKYEWSCKCCGTTHKRWGRVELTPTFCDECADKYDICKRCGADRELRDRKVLERKKK